MCHLLILGVTQLEQTGSTIFQTLAGISLDTHKLPKQNTVDAMPPNDTSIQYLLNIFVLLNVVQVLGILGLAHLDRSRKGTELGSGKALVERSPDALTSKSLRGTILSAEESPTEEQALVSDPRSDEHRHYSSVKRWTPSTSSACEATREEWNCGELYMTMCGGLIVFAWVLFLTTAFLRLRPKDGRLGGH
jgi:hypothetical protein